MVTSKFKLERYFFTQQEVRANPSHNPGVLRGDSSVEVNSTAGPSPAKPNQHFIEVIVSLDEANSENPPYFFRLAMFGIFNSAPELNEEEAHKLASTVGPQLLIGAARDCLASMTARGPWGSFFMDIVHIRPEGNETAEQSGNVQQ